MPKVKFDKEEIINTTFEDSPRTLVTLVMS